MVTVEDVGRIIGSDYTVRQLENGGQKEVFYVRLDDEEFVIKFVVIEARDEDDDSLIMSLDVEEERTRREVKLMSSVNSGFLPKLGPVDLQEITKDGLRYLVFSEEYVGDKSVKDLISEQYFIGHPARVKKLTRDIAGALKEYGAFENGFVHRDVKPGNIVRRNNSDEFVLIDGGVHLLPSNPTMTSSRAFIGTRKYASPEQLTEGRNHMDMRSDIFSLGLVMFEAATGSHQFYRRGISLEKATEDHINANFRLIESQDMNSFNSLIPRMLARYPHARYPTLEALILDIEGVVV